MNVLGIGTRLRINMLRRVQRLSVKLLDKQLLKEPVSSITEADICNLCCLLPDQFMNEPVCLELSLLPNNLHIVGDIRGQFAHIFHMFDTIGHPPETRYLFLGNYTQYSEKSIETLALLFCFKLLYPKSVYLLRGRHECEAVGELCGLYENILKRFTRRVWHEITTTFSYMPAAALLDNRILCFHGGLSPLFETNKVDTISNLLHQFQKRIPRPAHLTPNSLLAHMIWSDPDEETDRWDQNPIGMGYLFGQKAVANFCDRLDLIQIIRSAELVTGGYEFFKESRVLTIFSAPDLDSCYANDGAVVQILRHHSGGFRCKIKIMKPILRMRMKATTRMNMQFEEICVDLGRREIAT